MARRNAADAGAPKEMPSRMLKEARASAFRWALKKVDSDTAEDIASEVVSALWHKAQTTPRLITSATDRAKFVNSRAKHMWLKGKTSDERREAWEGAFAMLSQEPRHAWTNPEVEINYTQLADAFKELLDSMPAGRRDAFMLVHDIGCNYETAAGVLDISVEAAESRVSMVRKVLRTFLAKYLDEGDMRKEKKAKNEKKEKKARRNAA